MDETAPWQVKQFPIWLRKTVVDRAHAEDITVSAWVIRAVENEINRGRQTDIIAPGKPDKPAVSLDAVRVATEALAVLLADQSGRVTREAIRSACATVRDGMRVARGLDPARVYQKPVVGLLEG